MQEIKLDFIGIGAPRTGTTHLSTLLAEHPEICFSSRKELHYFNFDHIYSQGQTYLAKYFNHCPAGKIKGEWSTDYLYSPAAAQRIKEHNPNVKLLICLREPVERAYSHFLLQKYSASIMPFQSFRQAVTGHDKYNYLKLGFYSQPLRYYLSLFPRQNILILIYEEVVNNPEQAIGAIYEFLGVAKNFRPPSLNKNIDYRGRKKFYSLTIAAIVNKLIIYYKHSRFKTVLQHLQTRRLLRWLKKVNRRQVQQKFSKPAISQETAHELKRLYQSEIATVEKIIDRPLPIWKKLS
ncbi:MAG: sulfotransferase [Patescibacteria group bacterium]